jgi:dTDP-D-glucose 4,6-dehydratase
MPSVINSCLNNEDVKVSDCLNYQDYLHVEDTANGIISVLESNLEGAVNICSNAPIQLKEIVNKIGCMKEQTKAKMRKTVTRIVNEGRGGVICILL